MSKLCATTVDEQLAAAHFCEVGNREGIMIEEMKNRASLLRCAISILITYGIPGTMSNPVLISVINGIRVEINNIKYLEHANKLDILETMTSISSKILEYSGCGSGMDFWYGNPKNITCEACNTIMGIRAIKHTNERAKYSLHCSNTRCSHSVLCASCNEITTIRSDKGNYICDNQDCHRYKKSAR